jgi:flavorubredoxin
MAQSIVEGVASEGVDVQLCKVSTMDRSQIMREILDAKAVVLGTPTLNMGIFPTMADTAWYIKGLKPKNRYGAVFGSYGWASAGTKALKEVLANSGLEFAFEDVNIRFNPMEDGRKRCFEFGRTIAKKVMS